MAVSQRKNGSYVVSLRLTLRPGRDDELIRLVLNAPKGALSGLVREAMRSGIQDPESLFAEDPEEVDLDLSGLGMEL
jgi:hypothetical protein